jgi:uncharacterized repeat protein (TIGR03803 family)
MATYKLLFSFDGTTGATPQAGLLRDASGDLLGTTQFGGANTQGVVYELLASGGGYATTPLVLLDLDSASGINPQGGLYADAHGNLYGSGYGGGSSGHGTVFELASGTGGYAADPVVLANLGGVAGSFASGGLIADAAGNLYGQTQSGGTGLGGTVFELPRSGAGYGSPVTLVNFGDVLGSTPSGGLVMDAAGNLFGTTNSGGVEGFGTIFEIARTAGGYASTPTTLFDFDYTMGGSPLAGLIVDAAGNLFGTTSEGGANTLGTVFELVKSGGVYASAPTLLYEFDGTHGTAPYGGLLMDAAGNLFGTTYQGGASNLGTVFELAKTGGGYASTPGVLVSFTGANGANPAGTLIAGADGALFGTTALGGASDSGVVFEVDGAGFAVGGISITGAAGGQVVLPLGQIQPFGGVSLTDANPGQTVTVTVTQANPAAGTLSDPGAAADNGFFAGGVFTVSGTAAQVTAALHGLRFTASVADPGTLFTIAAQDSLGVVASDSASGVVMCFGEGTRIATPDGARAVETLRPGDRVSTADGAACPVRWLGVQTIAARFADPAKAWPVLVEAGALGAGLPLRDLVLSPGHALLLDGLLIQAGALAGCAGISRIAPPAEIFRYYHVELDRHALLLAEGALAESYLPVPEDLPFDNRGERVWADAVELPYPRVKAARQLPVRFRKAA